jgi:hypothetical protein
MAFCKIPARHRIPRLPLTTIADCALLLLVRYFRSNKSFLRNRSASMAASVAKPTREFAFIAFENASGKVMAHGPRAIDALSRADRLGANIEIEILAAGQAGVWIWQQNVPLAEARSALNQNSVIADRPNGRLWPDTGRR